MKFIVYIEICDEDGNHSVEHISVTSDSKDMARREIFAEYGDNCCILAVSECDI